MVPTTQERTLYFTYPILSDTAYRCCVIPLIITPRWAADIQPIPGRRIQVSPFVFRHVSCSDVPFWRGQHCSSWRCHRCIEIRGLCVIARGDNQRSCRFERTRNNSIPQNGTYNRTDPGSYEIANIGGLIPSIKHTTRSDDVEAIGGNPSHLTPLVDWVKLAPISPLGSVSTAAAGTVGMVVLKLVG